MSQLSSNPAAGIADDTAKAPIRSRARRDWMDKLFNGVCIAAAALSLITLAILLTSILISGLEYLDFGFLVSYASRVPAEAGILAGLVGTVCICLICALTAIPIGVGTAILLEEYKPTGHPVVRRTHEFIQLNISNLAGVPSIVYGLLGLTLFVQMFNFDFLGTPLDPRFQVGVEWRDEFITADNQRIVVPLDSGNAAPTDPAVVAGREVPGVEGAVVQLVPLSEWNRRRGAALSRVNAGLADTIYNEIRRQAVDPQRWFVNAESARQLVDVLWANAGASATPEDQALPEQIPLVLDGEPAEQFKQELVDALVATHASFEQPVVVADLNDAQRRDLATQYAYNDTMADIVSRIEAAELSAAVPGLVPQDAKPLREAGRKPWYLRIPLGRSIIAGGLTLMLVILPVIIVASQEALRSVPRSLRSGSLALGATPWQTTWNITLPAAIPGIMTGTILSMSRAIGEAAPILVISGAAYIASMPEHAMDNFTAMPLLIFNWSARAVSEFHEVAASGIIVLMAILLTFNAIAVYIRHRASSENR
jgi:phosphate transport system permease protein